MKKTLLSAVVILRSLWPTRAPVVEFFNADEIQIQTKLYAAKGGAYIGSHTNSVTLDMTGTHMASGTQAIGTGSDEALDVPADVSGQRWLEIKSLEAEGGNYIELATATGGSFAAAVFARVPAAGLFFGCIPSGTTIYAKANTGAVNIDWRTVQV